MTRTAEFRYGARVGLIVDHGVDLGFEQDVTLLVGERAAIRLRHTPKYAGEGSHLRHVEVSLEAFAKASHAEAQGEKLALGLLWAAVSIKYAARLGYTGNDPYTVYNRAAGTGLQVHASGFVVRPTSPHVLAEILSDVLASDIEHSPELLTSMELFTAARMEASGRARFVALVSAIEPLAKQQQYGHPIPELAALFAEQLDATEGIDPEVVESLRGRIRDLRRESVRLAIRRLVRVHLPGEDTSWQVVDEAYAARSDLLHEGVVYSDLGQRSAVIEDVIRRLYASMLGKTLYTKPHFAPATP